MANALTPSDKQSWARMMQIVREKELVAMGFCNFELREGLKTGYRAHKPYRSKMAAQSYTKGTAFTVQDISSTDEYLDVDTAKCVPFYIDSIDDMQNTYNTKDDFRVDAMNDLNEVVDADILSEYSNATSTMYAANIGESGATTPIIVTSGNILRIINKMKAMLRNYRVKKNLFIVMSPSMVSMLELYLAGKDTAWGDEVGKNGFVGMVSGVKILVSDNLTQTAKWTPADQPTTAATLTIGGITITLVTTLTGGANEVLIVTNTATTLDNLVAYLNLGNGAATANYTVQSDDAQAAFNTGMAAVDGTTFVTITYKGGGESALASSESADPWSLQQIHCLGGQDGAIDLVMQKYPSVESKDISNKLGVNIVAWMNYGKKTFLKSKDALVHIVVDQDQL